MNSHRRHSRCRSAPGPSTIPEFLAPAGSTWNGWWSTFDPTLPANPGVGLVVSDTDTWTDQRNGRVIGTAGASNRPPYAADGVHAGGRPGIQCAITGSKCLGGGADFASPLFASASRPYYVFVVRNRTAPVAENRLCENSEGATFRTNPLIWVNADQSAQCGLGAVSVSLGASSLNQSVAVFEAWNTITGSFIRKNGGTAVTNAAGTGGLSGQVTRLSLGSNRNGSGNFGDNTYWELYTFTSYIGDGVALPFIAALMLKWGVS